MSDEQKFGLTPEETNKIIDSILERRDCNHPTKSKSEGGNFFTAFDEGVGLMRDSVDFLEMFKITENE